MSPPEPTPSMPRSAAVQEHLLEWRQVVPRSLAETFPFFADPRNLARITPAWLDFRLLDEDPGPMREGLRLHYHIRPFKVRQGWTSEITAWAPPHRFVDEQVEGPYALWHHEHRFHEVDAGTEITDIVRYRLPFGPAGRLAHALIVRRQLRAIFDYRREAVRELLG